MNIGDKWNGWTVDSFIDEGSFGKVYRLVRHEFGHTYESALKVIRIPQSPEQVRSVRNTGMDEESVRDFFREMVEEIVKELALMADLRGNTNIVGYEDHSVIELTEDSEDGFGWEICLRMEMLTPFWTYIKENPMTVEDTVRLGIDICRALEICQDSDIIHRDIKPENIFVSKRGDFKLGDFGIARQMDKTSGEMSKKGTVSYMAPEVYRGARYDATVDTYSLGIVLYRLLNNNRLPFLPPYPEKIGFRDSQNAAERRFSGVPLPKPVNADDKLSAVVLKACAYDPADRFGSAAEMRRALEEVARDMSDARNMKMAGDPRMQDTGDNGYSGDTGALSEPEGNGQTVSIFAMPRPETIMQEVTMPDPEIPDIITPDPAQFEPGAEGKTRSKLLIAAAAVVLIAGILLVISGLNRKVITGIDARYDGAAEAGIEINNESRFTVVAHYRDGQDKEVDDWTVDECTLQEGVNTVTIRYEDQTATCDIEVPEASVSGRNRHSGGKYTASVEEIRSEVVDLMNQHWAPDVTVGDDGSIRSAEGMYFKTTTYFKDASGTRLCGSEEIPGRIEMVVSYDLTEDELQNLTGSFATDAVCIVDALTEEEIDQYAQKNIDAFNVLDAALKELLDPSVGFDEEPVILRLTDINDDVILEITKHHGDDGNSLIIVFK